MRTVIRVENLSKQYRLGEIGTGTISHDINRWWHRVRGKEDPYLKIGEENDRAKKASSDYVWALRDVNFEVRQGEVLGIIGRNGAGKSTLLKILSRTTTPTTGQVKMKGRIASLLEVGTGFHPELSGRDNIFLNGAILGMTRKEIARKFDEIVDFAGVERYIDTPVKRYSSGMYVRLAFAVAAHLEPDILIVDEVLAVGDAEFQSKCLGKMKDVSDREGRTVLFVSHNMGAIKTLCQTSLLMQTGKLMVKGDTNSVVNQYLSSHRLNVDEAFVDNLQIGDEEIFITSFGLANSSGEYKRVFSGEEEIFLEINYSVLKPQNNFRFQMTITDQYNAIICTSFDLDLNQYKARRISPGNYTARVNLPPNLLNEGMYYIIMDGSIFDQKSIFKKWQPVSFVIEHVHEDFTLPDGARPGPILTYFNWEHTKH